MEEIKIPAQIRQQIKVKFLHEMKCEDASMHVCAHVPMFTLCIFNVMDSSLLQIEEIVWPIFYDCTISADYVTKCICKYEKMSCVSVVLCE